MHSAIGRRTMLITGSISAASFVLCKGATAQTASNDPSALQILMQRPEFSDWVQTLQFAGLSQYADSKPAFTAFVPTNTVFEKYPDVLAEVLRRNDTLGRDFPDTSTQVSFIRSHVIRDIHPLSECRGKVSILTSLSGNPITVDGTGAGFYMVTWVSVDQRVATSRIEDKPIVASNALIYPINSLTLD